MNNRAQAIGIARLFLGLGVGAAVYWIVSLVTDPLFDHAKEQGSGQVATNATTWLQMGVDDVMIILFLFVSFFGLIAYSVYSREAVR